MTDNINISSIDFTGKSGALPRWATEQAMNSLSDEVRRLADSLTKSASGKGGNKDIFKDLSKAQKETIGNFNELNDSMDSFASRAENVGEKFSKSGRRASGVFGAVSSGAKTVTGGLMKMKSGTSNILGKFKKLAGPIGILIGAFGALGSIVGKVIGIITNTADAYMELYNSGITFQQGMFEMRKAAGAAAMPLENFSELVLKSSEVVAALGKNGAATLGQISEQTRKLTMDQGMFGASLKQVNEFTTSYLETQRLQGFIQKRSKQELAKSNAEYLKNLTLFSQALGKSREEIAKEAETMSRRVDVFGVLSSLPEDIRKQSTDAYNKAVMGIAGTFGDSSEEFNRVFGDLVVNTNDYQNEFIQALSALPDSDLDDKIVNFANGIKEGTVKQEEVGGKLADIISDFKNLSPAAKKTLSNQIQIGQTFSEGSKSIMGFVRNVEDIEDEGLKKLRKGIVEGMGGEFPSAIQRFREQFRTISGKFEEFVAEVFLKNMDSIKKLMNFATSKTDEIAKFIKETMELLIKVLDPKTREQALKKLEDKLMGAMEGLMDKLMEALGRSLKSLIKSLYESIARIIDENLNPFSRSAEERKSQESANKTLQNKIEQFKKNQKSEEDKKTADALKNFMSYKLKEKDFVDDIEDTVHWEDLGRARKMAKKIGFDLEGALQPILSKNENFREQFRKIKKSQDLGMSRKELSIHEMRQRALPKFRNFDGTSPAQPIERMNRQNTTAEMVAGATRARSSQNQTSQMRNISNSQGSNNIDGSAGQDRLAEQNNYLKRQLEIQEQTNKHIENMVREQVKSVRASKETVDQIKRNSNVIR